MAGLTRRELKRDEFRTTLDELEQFFKERYKEILSAVGIIAVVVGAVVGLKTYNDRQEERAATQLGVALKTFHAYVGAATPGSLPDTQTFPTAQEKYKRSLEQFSQVTQRFPRTQAAAIARYHVGECQAELNDQAAAIKTLQDAAGASDRNIAALAKLALGGELAKGGKVEDAAKIYQDLADHATTTVPKATALLAMADAYRASRPAQARQIYEQVQKDFSADPSIARFLTQQVASLPK